MTDDLLLWTQAIAHIVTAFGLLYLVVWLISRGE